MVLRRGCALGHGYRWQATTGTVGGSDFISSIRRRGRGPLQKVSSQPQMVCRREMCSSSTMTDDSNAAVALHRKKSISEKGDRTEVLITPSRNSRYHNYGMRKKRLVVAAVSDVLPEPAEPPPQSQQFGTPGRDTFRAFARQLDPEQEVSIVNAELKRIDEQTPEALHRKLAYLNLGASLARNSRSSAAMVVFHQMLSKGLAGSQECNTFLYILGRQNLIYDIKSAVQLMRIYKVPFTLQVYEQLGWIYSSHGHVDAMKEIFAQMHEKDGIREPSVKLYNYLIKAQTEHGEIDAAYNIYRKMGRGPVFPNTYTMNILMHGLAKFNYIQEVEHLYSEMKDNPKLPFPDHVTRSTILLMYARANNMEAVDRFEHEIRFSTGLQASDFTALCSVYRFHGRLDKVVGYLREMQEEKMIPRAVLMRPLLEAARDMNPSFDHLASLYRMLRKSGMAADPRALIMLLNAALEESSEGKAVWTIHQLFESGLDARAKVFNSIVNEYAKTGNVSGAKMVLEVMKANGIAPNTVTWNMLMQAHQISRKNFELQELFYEMDSIDIPKDRVSYILFFKACARLRFREVQQRARAVSYDYFDRAVSQAMQTADETVMGAAVYMFCSWQRMRSAEEILQYMADKVCAPSKKTVTPIIRAYARMGNYERLTHWAKYLQERGQLDDLVTSNIIRAYSRRKNVTTAKWFYNELKQAPSSSAASLSPLPMATSSSTSTSSVRSEKNGEALTVRVFDAMLTCLRVCEAFEFAPTVVMDYKASRAALTLHVAKELCAAMIECGLSAPDWSRYLEKAEGENAKSTSSAAVVDFLEMFSTDLEWAPISIAEVLDSASRCFARRQEERGGEGRAGGGQSLRRGQHVLQQAKAGNLDEVVRTLRVMHDVATELPVDFFLLLVHYMDGERLLQRLTRNARGLYDGILENLTHVRSLDSGGYAPTTGQEQILHGIRSATLFLHRDSDRLHHGASDNETHIHLRVHRTKDAVLSLRVLDAVMDGKLELTRRRLCNMGVGMGEIDGCAREMFLDVVLDVFARRTIPHRTAPPAPSRTSARSSWRGMDDELTASTPEQPPQHHPPQPHPPPRASAGEGSNEDVRHVIIEPLDDNTPR